MPGLSLIRTAGDLDDTTVERGLESTRHRDDYASRELYRDDGTALVATAYPDYPIEVVETHDAVVVLEGYLYDVGADEATLRTIANWVIGGRTERLASWLDQRDGDFLLAVVEKSNGTVHLANDSLGRLPTYQTTEDGTTVVSREIAFVRTVLADRTDTSPLDPLGVAQTLLFGYQLDTRTLFEHVERLPPGTLAHVGPGGSVELNRRPRFDFQRTDHRRRSRQTNAARLKSLFVEACRNRAAVGGTNVIALSGGLDSRTVAAGFEYTEYPLSAATYRLDGEQSADVRMAGEVADVLDLEWDTYDVSGGPDHRDTLLTLKQGLNYLYVDFMVDFLEQLRAETGSPTILTGDGGDKALPDLTPGRPLRNLDDLVEYTLARNAVLSPDEAASIAGIDRRELLDSVRERFQTYPEVGHDAQYVHFLVRERGINWLNEGEDRNRYFGWSASPFYAQPFFRYAMNVPPEQKHGNRLYHEFLGTLSPTLLDVEYADFGAAPSSVEYLLKRRGYDALGRYPRAQDAILRLLRNDTDDHPDLVRRIQHRLAEATFPTLESEQIQAALAEDRPRDEVALSHLDTITAAAQPDRRVLPLRTTETDSPEQPTAIGEALD